MSHQAAVTDKGLVVSAPVKRFFGYYPGVVSVVTVAHDGQQNVMSAGWHAALSASPPLYGVAIAPERFSHALLVNSGVFAVHFLPFERVDAIAGAGCLSGHDGLDKFQRLGLSYKAGVVIDVPILQDAYLAYECQLRDRVPTGEHDWFVGEVVAVHYLPEAFDERFLQLGEVVSGAVYYGRSIYEEIGKGQRTELHPEAFRSSTTPSDS